jgi:hypothetical protein
MQPIYKMFLGRYTPAWQALGAEDQRRLQAEVEAAFKTAGGQSLIQCTAEWSQDAWQWFGVESFPSVEAVRQYHQQLELLRWQRYTVEIMVLGTEKDVDPPRLASPGP